MKNLRIFFLNFYASREAFFSSVARKYFAWGKIFDQKKGYAALGFFDYPKIPEERVFFEKSKIDLIKSIFDFFKKALFEIGPY